MSGLEVRPLEAAPDLVPAAAGLVFAEWGSHRFGNPAEMAEAWRAELTGTALPRRFVARLEGRFAGMAALKAQDLAARSDLTPWLGDVVVVPACRRRGVATALVAAVEQAAAARGIARLYLHSWAAAELYARLGWQVVGEAPHHATGATTVMAKSLTPAA